MTDGSWSFFCVFKALLGSEAAWPRHHHVQEEPDVWWCDPPGGQTSPRPADGDTPAPGQGTQRLGCRTKQETMKPRLLAPLSSWGETVTGTCLAPKTWWHECFPAGVGGWVQTVGGWVPLHGGRRVESRRPHVQSERHVGGGSQGRPSHISVVDLLAVDAAFRQSVRE